MELKRKGGVATDYLLSLTTARVEILRDTCGEVASDLRLDVDFT